MQILIASLIFFGMSPSDSLRKVRLSGLLSGTCTSTLHDFPLGAEFTKGKKGIIYAGGNYVDGKIEELAIVPDGKNVRESIQFKNGRIQGEWKIVNKSGELESYFLFDSVSLISEGAIVNNKNLFTKLKFENGREQIEERECMDSLGNVYSKIIHVDSILHYECTKNNEKIIFDPSVIRPKSEKGWDRYTEYYLNNIYKRIDMNTDSISDWTMNQLREQVQNTVNYFGQKKDITGETTWIVLFDVNGESRAVLPVVSTTNCLEFDALVSQRMSRKRIKNKKLKNKIVFIGSKFN